MEGGESKLESVLSWADEVELEEAAVTATRAQTLSEQKPNPFGNARPREIVLKEKGIDWKKMDHDMQQSPHQRQEAKVKMLHKQSISVLSAPINRKQLILPSRLRTKELEYSNFGFDRTEAFLIAQNQSPVIIVPPLRYPPKTVAGKLFEPEKENRDHELDRISFHNLQTLNPRCHIDPHFNQQVLSSKSMYAVFSNGGTRSELGKSVKAQNNDTNLEKPTPHKIQEYAYSAHPRNKCYGKKMVGASPKSERRGPPQIHYKSCIPAGEKDQKHIQCNYAKNMVARHLMNSSNKVTNQQKRQNQIDSSKNETCRMVRFVAQEAMFIGSAVNGAQAGALQSINKDQADYFGKANKKDRTNYSRKHKKGWMI